MLLKDGFRKLAHKTSEAVGSPFAFFLAALTIAAWLITGPLFNYSDTWQLVINTATTIITFLIVFLIQNSQNRDARVFHLKLDEIIRGVKGARNEPVDLEDMADDELERIQKEFKHLHDSVAKKLEIRTHKKTAKT